MTLTLTALSVAIGFNLGLGLAILRGSDNSWLSGFARYYSIVFRGTPLLVQIFLIYYGLGQINFIHDTPAMWWVVSEGSRLSIIHTSVCIKDRTWRAGLWSRHLKA